MTREQIKSKSSLEINHRFRALDGLRGVAAILVVFYHIDYYRQIWPNSLTNYHFIRNGYLAVDLFFILSGVVITATYAAKITDLQTSVRFVALRFFRVYPLHLITLGILVLLETVKLLGQHYLGGSQQQPFTGDRSLEGLIQNLLFINGWHVSDVASWNGPSWSVSSEWAVYLIVPLLFSARLERKEGVLYIGGFLALGIYALLAWMHDTLDLTSRWGIVRCFAGFWLGMLIMLFSARLSWKWRLQNLSIMQAVCAAMVLLIMSFAEGPQVAAVIPFFVALILSLMDDRPLISRVFTSRPAQFLGRVSYSIYMVHVIVLIPFLFIQRRLMPVEEIDYYRTLGDVLVVLALITIVLVAVLTHRFIEEPARKFGRKYFSLDRRVS